MSKRHLGVVTCTVLIFFVLTVYGFKDHDNRSDIASKEPSEIDITESQHTAPPAAMTLARKQSIFTPGSPAAAENRAAKAENIMEEVAIRLKEHQTDEALNELNALLDRYHELTYSEKSELLSAYASLFLKKGQYADAMFFYEQSLLIPNMLYENRLAILQMLARISIAAEDWPAFLNYNDQYFAEGGGYNWLVTGHLMSAYFRLGNFDAVGQSLLIHFDTGIHPEFDGSEEQYQRRYKRYENIPLQMTSPEALNVAIALAEEFDRPGNWEVLAQVYASRSDRDNYQRVIDIGKEKGFVDSSGNWLSNSEAVEF